MKKLLIITFLSTVLLWITNIFVYYLLDYPNELEILKIIKENVEWKPLLLIYLALIFISIISSFLFFKNRTFLNKFCRIMITFNIIGMIIMSVIGINRFIENKKYFDEILTEFREKAKNDIKNDDVKTFGFGLPLPPKNKVQAIEKTKTDSILKIYGLKVKNLGCTISIELTKASEEYERITEVYLTKRNGKGWRLKMENEIQKVKKNYR
jgi:L-cystine uptake protein TcyP (sodium:dicarboxylate symporter family)